MFLHVYVYVYSVIALGKALQCNIEVGGWVCVRSCSQVSRNLILSGVRVLLEVWGAGFSFCRYRSEALFFLAFFNYLSIYPSIYKMSTNSVLSQNIVRSIGTTMSALVAMVLYFAELVLPGDAPCRPPAGKTLGGSGEAMTLRSSRP